MYRVWIGVELETDAGEEIEVSDTFDFASTYEADNFGEAKAVAEFLHEVAAHLPSLDSERLMDAELRKFGVNL